MKILHVITGLDVGGAEGMLTRLVEYGGMTHLGVVSLSGEGALATRIRQAGVAVHALGMRPGRPDVSAVRRLVRLLREQRPDLVQTWLYHADLVGLVAATVAGRVPVVWNLRCAELDPGDHPRSLPALLRLLAWLSSRPAAVVANSTAGRRAHEALGYRPRRWEIIPNGFDTDRFAPDATARPSLQAELGVASDVRLVGLLARLHPMKDHATFLEAAARVVRRAGDLPVRFLVAGRGVDSDATLRAQVAALGLERHVSLTGERADTARVLAGLDVAVSASYGEAFPNVVGEAMACGTPCVVTDVGDSATIVGGTGVVVPPRDPEALASGIMSVLELSDGARAEARASARSRIMSEFSMAAAAARYRGLYASLIEGLA